MNQHAQHFEQAIRQAKSVLIGTHLNPDGDALGSALALSQYLDGLGINNEVLCHHAPPANLKFLPGVKRVRQIPKGSDFDLGVILDLDSTERLGSTAEFFQSLSNLMVIDHHVPHEAPGDLRIIDQKAAATAVILSRLLLEIGANITPEMATCLLTGIVTDTGSFRFRNTNAEALVISGRLLEAGGNINLVTEEVFQRKPLASARLLGFLLERMVLDCDDRLSWGAISFEDFQSTGAKDEDTEGFVNELLAIETVQLAAIFRQTKPQWVRVSIRSRGDLDVSAVAREFGGGGHRNAAGCSFDMALDDAIDLVVPRLRQCLASS
jgi:phosphoesterase RecJ-like protein